METYKVHDVTKIAAVARVPADYRPIASVRLFYKIFAYMMLARVEPALEIHQPEEQHGFRKGHRIEEHLLTANLVVDKLLAVSTPIWIVSLDLSKAFDRVSWDKLWVALQAHGVSDHLVWTMQNLYTGQLGQIQGDTGDSRVFPITAGVRQGCVLSPRLFTAILQWAMQKWRQRVENSACGIDLEDGGSKLLDLRFADDLLLFARSKFEAIFMLETLMEELAYVGLCLNAGKTVVLTNEAQPPQCLILTNQDDNCRKRQRCWTQMVGLYFVSWGLWKVNFGHHLSFTGRLKGILCQQTDSL